MHVYKQWKHKSWGNSIEFNDQPSLTNRGPYKVHGWLERIPEVGDILLVRAYGLDDYLHYEAWSVGKVAILELEFTKVEPYRDPPDMFKAEVSWKMYRPNTEDELIAEQGVGKFYNAIGAGYYEPFKGYVTYESSRFGSLV